MAVDMFLKIDGVTGESTDAGHKDEIDLLSYTWAESQPAAPGGNWVRRSLHRQSGDAGLSFCHARQQGVAKIISVMREWSAHQERHSHRAPFWGEPGRNFSNGL